MTILFFSRLFYPHIGGVEKHVLEISRFLIKKGYKVSVLTEKHEKKLKSEEKFEGIKIYRIPNFKNDWFKKFKIWKWLWRNRSLIKSADIVHCHDVFFWYFPFRFLFPRKPVYTTFHGYESYPILKKAIWVRQVSSDLSFGIICIGSFMKKWYDAKSTFITYGGVDFANSKFKVSRHSGIPQAAGQNSKLGAVFVGRLDEQTGIKTYANAVKLIRVKIPNFKFEIIGDGKFGKEIRKDFKVLGFKKDPEKYFQKFRFAFVSRYLSILEAMTAKRLVFAVYDNPLKEDYLKMTPFAKLINIINSEKELADKILYFLKNPKKEQIIIDKAFEWVKKHTWEEMTNTYLKLWNKQFR